jgi:Tfp pilus assembly protein PilO
VKVRLLAIGLGAAVVITAAWYFALWKPKGHDLDTAKANEAAAESRASQAQTRLNHLKRLEANATVLEADRVKFAAAIPTADELDNFLHQVNDRATKAGVDFVTISPTPPAAGGAPGASGPSAVGLQMQVTGDYFAILRFLEQLRDGERLVTVENFSLSKSGEGNQMSASIGGRMFIAPAVVVPTATPTTTPAG